ncbi:SOSS complex subunit C [Tetranychus urticae]|uniref:SOSS complex subunit C homolog n=1 Tax=Tetranychus urticae TaxID=32264 RepID=T1L2D1_TETUR|nr:SOSS complex subunit C [Tetranychus urticae]
MSFQGPNPRQAVDRIRALEDVQKKQQLLKQSQLVGQASVTNNPGTNQAFIDTNYSINMTNNNMSLGSNNSNQRERSAYHAHQNTFGYFITQDSAFGNLILPVLPRFT